MYSKLDKWSMQVQLGGEEGCNRCSVLRRMALNMLKAETRSQGGVAAKRKRAGWDEDYLLLVLAN